MTSDQDDHGHGHDQGRDDKGPELPEHPESRQTETVQALEDQHAGDAPDDEEQVRGEDVGESPADEEMEGLPGPPPGEPDEPSG